MSRKNHHRGYIRQTSSMMSQDDEASAAHNNDPEPQHPSSASTLTMAPQEQRQQQYQQRPFVPAIYAVPTSETFDDSFSAIPGVNAPHPLAHSQSSSYSHSLAQNGRVRSHGSQQSAAVKRRLAAIPSGGSSSQMPPTAPPATNHPSPSSASRKGRPASSATKATNNATTAAAASTTTPNVANRRAQQQPQKQQPPPKKKPAVRNPNNNINRDFQFEQDWPTVSVKTVNVSVRSAYEVRPCPSIAEWKELAERSSTQKHLRRKRLSPSLQHLELVQQLQRQTAVRQLCFAPSVSLDADPFVGPAAALGRDRPSRHRRDGRYRPVPDIVQAYTANLPSQAPILSHQKWRLPTRADVGFPGATEAEIVQKQGEIQNETAWEEATPRLIVLIASTDLGSVAAEDESFAKQRLSRQHWQWNGGGLPGMPFCGKHLMRAMEQNAVQWGRPSPRRRHQSAEDSHHKTAALGGDWWKPNPTSVLAPPLDATYSRSQGWRPRPFHDRPPGLDHAVVCPTSVDFPVGAIEPLLGSLTLYRLPVSGSRKGGPHHSFGKISEEYWFPTGDWRGKVQPKDVGLGEESSDAEGAALLEAWHARKHKAVFSYESSTSHQHGDGGEDASTDGCDTTQLFVLLKVFKVAQHAPKENYGGASAPQQRTQRSNRRNHKDDRGEKANLVFTQFGMRLLTPLCFGLTRLCDDENSLHDDMVDDLSFHYQNDRWPNGLVKDMELWPLPMQPESQEAFVDRLIHMVADKETSSKFTKDHHHHGPTQNGGKTTAAAPSLTKEDSKRSRGVGRIFRSPMKNRGNHTAKPSQTAQQQQQSTAQTPLASGSGSTHNLLSSPQASSVSHTSSKSNKSNNTGSSNHSLQPSATCCGTAKLFVSHLGVDFLESMLSEPFELLTPSPQPHPDNNNNPASRLPKLLVDPTGDGAVMLRSNDTTISAVVNHHQQPHKRSDLVRLPAGAGAADYLAAAELREVLHLPARSEKSFEADPPLLSYRSLANLLYVYPRSLKLLSGGSNLSSFTVRVRLVQTEVPSDTGGAGAVKPCPLIHSSTPWAGQSLVESFYTVIAGNLGTSDYSPNLKHGAPLTDEIKVRLPLLLDGSYSLEFALFAVQASPDQGISLQPVVPDSTLIPLSSSGTRDAGSGAKVATIIPNGNHRVKLGDFQLTFETRIISSLHVGDAAVALALRDFPLAKMTSAEHHNTPAEDSNTVKSMDSSVDLARESQFAPLLSTAAPATVVAHFPVLLHMHLCNLVNVKDKVYQGQSSGTQFMMATMSSLFELIKKAKANFVASSESSSGKLARFIKRHVDLFDEVALSIEADEEHDVHNDNDADSSGEPPIVPDSDSVQAADQFDDAGNDERLDEVAVSLRSRTKHNKSFQARVSKVTAEVGAVGVPLARSAYGASKIDRMRVEAEMHAPMEDGHFFDDDETVATMSTFHAGTEVQQQQQRESIVSQPSLAQQASKQHMAVTASASELEGVAGTNYNSTILGTGSELEQQESSDGGSEGNGAAGPTEFARRVKTAAQVMLAPCVGPTLANILAPGKSTSPRSGSSIDPMDALKEEAQEKMAEALKKAQQQPPTFSISQSGSDVEDEAGDVAGDPVAFRGPQNAPILMFSAAQGSEHGNYLYETVMLLWLRAWLDRLEDGIDAPGGAVDNMITSFVLPPSNPSQQQQRNQPIFSFFANMDFLLPLCTKSIALRYSLEVLPQFPPSTKAVVDEGHLRVLEPFVEILARGLMGQALSGLQTVTSKGHGEDSALNTSLLRALQSAGVVHDFFAGLIAVVHPEHMHSLIAKYFRTLRDCETEHLGDLSSMDFMWTDENLHRVRSSRQLRLEAVESLSAIPSFLAINYPRKYTAKVSSSTRFEKPDWLHQYSENSTADNWDIKRTDDEKLPTSGWLSELLTKEALSICSLSSESVVAEAMAHVEVAREAKSTAAPGNIASSLKKRPGATLKRSDLLMFQSLSTQAITCVYEIVLRRHVMDRRFQAEGRRARIAGMMSGPILEKSIGSVRWLARMEANHRVRSTWLLCLIYTLQEAPDNFLSQTIRSYCDPKDFKIHKFVRLLRLCTSSFQSFIDRPSDSKLTQALDKGLSAWLLQESFNTICAATNSVVDACAGLTSNYPHEERKMLQGLLDLLLHILTTPQSSVTHLRAVGGALQTLEKFGIALFTEITGTNFQHWIRVVLTLMNSISLSVRSIAVDFLVSLVGSIFDTYGNIGEVSLVMVSVLPEVAAREIALYSVRDHINSFEDVARAVWPLRRSLVDLDGNPLDDDRIDPQLSPVLSSLCRACQAVIDGVLIELRLKGNKFLFPSSDFVSNDSDLVFDADEESLYEAATFFLPETGAIQRIRWFMTLRSVHERKGQWVEAAEALMMCSRTILESIRHLRFLWRPSKFLLWSDSRRSHWLETVGEESSQPERGNSAVIDFANDFLEPITIVSDSKKPTAANKLHQPTATAMCEMLSGVTKEAIALYLREGGTEEQALTHLLSLQRTAMNLLEGQGPRISFRGAAARRRFEEDSALRKALVGLGVEITSLTERMHLDEPFRPSHTQSSVSNQVVHVFVQLCGKKPPRFEESTALPCFLEWQETSICRVPKAMQEANGVSSVQDMCSAFAQPLMDFLTKQLGEGNVIFVNQPLSQNQHFDEKKTYLVVCGANCAYGSEGRWLGAQCRRFYSDFGQAAPTVEMTVAQPFPCPLSRQRSVLTTETAAVPVPLS